MLGGAGKEAGRHPGSAVLGPGVWILSLAPSGPSDRCLRAHSGSPERDAEAVSEEGGPGRGSAPAFGGAPQPLSGRPFSSSPALVSASSPTLQETTGQLWGPCLLEHRHVGTCGQRGPVPQNLLLTLTMTLTAGMTGPPGQGVGPFSTGQGSPACRSTSGPALASGWSEDSFYGKEPCGHRVGPAEMS